MSASPASADSCFSAAQGLLSLDAALALIAERIHPVAGVETVPLGAALGRVLAEEVRASITAPGFAASAMDGFAVAHASLNGEGPWTLPVVGRIAAGHPFAGRVPPGAAVEIFTGAPMPDGVDSVVMVEDTTRGTDDQGRPTVTLKGPLKAGNHVRPAGEDFTAGDLLLRPGRRLRPQEVHLAGTTGQATLAVRRRLRVGVFSTGDEVVEPGQPLTLGQVYGGNRYGQMAVIAALGHEAVDLGHLPDDPAVIAAALTAAAKDHDALLTSGGVSVGGEDHVRAVIEQIGTLHMWRLALKPGKPVTLGTIGHAAGACVFLGMPGYPVSAMVTTMLVARAVLARMAGAVAEPVLPAALTVPAAFTYHRKHGRREFLRACLDIGEDGATALRLYPRQGSGVVNSLAHSDGLADLREDVGSILPGDPVPFLPFASLLW